MNKKLLYLLLLTGCCFQPVINLKNNICMLVSNAQPIEMWLNGQLVYNDQNPDYIDKNCFHQEWNCAREMRWQIRESDANKSYSLQIYDAVTGALLQTLPYIKTVEEVPTSLPALQFLNPTFDINMANWHNWEEDNPEGGDWEDMQEFVWNASGIEAIGDRPDAGIYQKRVSKWPAGDYTVKVIAANSSTGGSVPLEQMARVYGSNAGFSIFSSPTILTVYSTGWTRGAGFQTAEISFTLAEDFEGIGFVFFKPGSNLDSHISFRIVDIEFTAVPDTTTTGGATYDLTFTPTTYGLCDRKLMFKIIDEDDSIVAYSDKVQLSSSPHANILIRYKSIKNFASLKYSVDSPYFEILIPGRFFKERNVTEQESLGLSNNIIINVASQLKKQRQLVVDYMPDYMHNKILLALQHAISGSVRISNGIDEYEWIVESEYEMIESQSERFAEQAARIWLTRKNYYLTNVI